MSQSGTFRMPEAPTYLRISRQRVQQMHAEGKLPEPDEVDGIGLMWWKATTIERWAEHEWWDTRRWRQR